MSKLPIVHFEQVPEEKQHKVSGTCGNCIHSGPQGRTYEIIKTGIIMPKINIRYGFPFCGCKLLPKAVIKDVDDWCSYQCDRNTKEYSKEHHLQRRDEAISIEEELEQELYRKMK